MDDAAPSGSSAPSRPPAGGCHAGPVGTCKLTAAAGHAARSGTGLRVVHDSTRRSSLILKELDSAELAIYERLFSADFPDDSMRTVVPQFRGVEKEADGKGFLRLENLTNGMLREKVMDVKLGVRTFQEAECLNKKPRPDMFERALDLFGDLLTEDEREAKSMTKARFMSLRDATSTIGILGYRIDGVAGYGRENQDQAEQLVKKAKTSEDCYNLIKDFVRLSATDEEGRRPEHSAARVACTLRAKLVRIREAIEKSLFVSRHEFIGTSLLMVCDANEQVRIAWIDFAKTEQIPQDMTVTHSCPWHPGTHEDGILLGLDGLIAAFGRMVIQFEGEEGPRRPPAAAAVASRDRSSVFGFWWCCRDSTVQETSLEEHFSAGAQADDASGSYPALEVTGKSSSRPNGFS